MKITNITDYDNMTDDYSKSLSKNNNCTDSEFFIDIFTPSLIFTIPFGLSFLCLMILMLYTLIRPLFNKKNFLELYE